MKAKYFVILFAIIFAIIAAGSGCASCGKGIPPTPRVAQPMPGLIKDVAIRAIVADTSLYGTKVDTTNPPPPPWRTRFKIALDSDSLNTISENRNFNYEGTIINFKDSDGYTSIAGFNFNLLQGDTLQVDFWIPETIPSWNVDQDAVLMVVNVTAATASLTTDKAGFFLLPLALMETNSGIDEESINEAVYEETNSFNGEFEDDHTTNGLTGGTDLDDE